MHLQPPRLTQPRYQRADGGSQLRDDSPNGSAYMQKFSSYDEQSLEISPTPSPYPGVDTTYRGQNGTLNRSATGTLRGNARRGYTKAQWCFLGVVLVQAVIALGIESYVFAEFQVDLAPWVRKEDASKPYAATVPTYLALFIFGFCYEVALVWDALRLKNTIQVIGLCLYNIGLLIEAAIQFLQLSDVVEYLGAQTPPAANAGPAIEFDFKSQVHPYIIAMPAVIGLGTVLMVVIAWFLFKEFTKDLYDQRGASKDVKTAVRYMEVYISLLKFDFFFFLAFTVLFLVVVEDTGSAEFYLTIAAIPVTIAVLLFAYYCAKRESSLGMGATIAIYVAALGYFGFKLFRMWFGPTSRIDDYLPARRSLTTFAIITIVLLVTTIIIASICTSKFGKDLFDRQNDRDQEEIPMNTTHQRPPNRRIPLDA